MFTLKIVTAFAKWLAKRWPPAHEAYINGMCSAVRKHKDIALEKREYMVAAVLTVMEEQAKACSTVEEAWSVFNRFYKT